MIREPLSKRLRFEVFKRDSFRCSYCGRTPPDVVLHVDHVIPVAEGGTNDEGNLTTSCQACNLGKGARQLGSVPAPLKPPGETEQRERLEQLAAYREWIREWNNQRAELEELQIQTVAEAYFGESGVTFATEATITRRQVLGFIRRLGIEVTAEMAGVAHGAGLQDSYRQWKYFCGCCWRRIRGEGPPAR